MRSLRNTTDAAFEINQYRYLQDLMPDIRVASFFGDREFEHISSSAIRQLIKLDCSVKKYLPQHYEISEKNRQRLIVYFGRIKFHCAVSV